MKEQTPIEQKLKSIISVELMDLSIMDEVVEHKTDEIYKGVMVIINAKVLEALENCCGMSREQAIHAIKRMKQK